MSMFQSGMVGGQDPQAVINNVSSITLLLSCVNSQIEM